MRGQRRKRHVGDFELAMLAVAELGDRHVGPPPRRPDLRQHHAGLARRSVRVATLHRTRKRNE